VRERQRVACVISLYALLALGYSLLLPIWEAPDESAHYRYALHLAREGSIPSRSTNHEAAQPPAYYWSASRALLLLDALDPTWADFYEPPSKAGRVPRYEWGPENERFLVGPHILRCINVGLGVFTALLIYHGSRRFAPDASGIPLAALALTVLSPQFLHNSASIGNDALANLVGSALFWQMARISADLCSPRALAATAVAAAVLPMLTKLTLLPMSLSVLLVIGWRARARWRPILIGGLLAGLVFLAILTLLPVSAERLWRAVVWRTTTVRPVLEVWTQHMPYLVRSYWGFLGWAAVPLPWLAAGILTALAGLGGLAFIRFLLWRPTAIRPTREPRVLLAFTLVVLLAAAVNSWMANLWAAFAIVAVAAALRRERDLPGSRRGWAAVALASCLALLAVGRNALATGAAQGRLLFPAAGAISLVIASGWWTLLPRRRFPAVPCVVVVVMLTLNLYLWFARLIPIYHQPFLD